jgi:hypothetical protein
MPCFVTTSCHQLLNQPLAILWHNASST